MLFMIKNVPWGVTVYASMELPHVHLASQNMNTVTKVINFPFKGYYTGTGV